MSAGQQTRRSVAALGATAALLLLASAPAGATVYDELVGVGAASAGNGWAPHPSQDGAGTERLVEGPETPPAGRGSLEMTTPANADRALIFTTTGTGPPPLDAIAHPFAGTTGGYSSYVFGGGGANVPILKLVGYLDYDTDNPLRSDGFTTLNFPGAIQATAVKAGEWQTWTLGPTSKVWQSADDDGFCGQDSPCTFSAFVAHYPNGAWGSIQLGLGNGVPNGRGFVDDVTITTGGTTHTSDFEIPASDRSTAAIAKGKATSTGGTVSVKLDASKLAADSVVFDITKVDKNGKPVDPPEEVAAGATKTVALPVPFGTTTVIVKAQGVTLATLPVTFTAPVAATTDDGTDTDTGNDTDPTTGTGTSNEVLAASGGSTDSLQLGLAAIAVGIVLVAAGTWRRPILVDYDPEQDPTDEE